MSTQTSIDGPVNLQEIVPEITQRISESAPSWWHKFLKVMCVAEKILAVPLALTLGMLLALIIYFFGMQSAQKENQELRQTIQELRISNQLLADQKQTLHPPTLARSVSSDKKNSVTMRRIKRGGEAGLVIDMRKYEPKDLPSLQVLLGKLRRRNILATFIFDPTFSNSDFTPKIFVQLKELGHEVGFAEKLWEYAGNDTPIMTSNEQKNGGKFKSDLRFDFTRRIDAKGPSVNVLQNLVQGTKPGEIVLVDPLNPKAVQALMTALPHHSNPNSLRMVKVGELLRQRDRPST
jgi:hypothetical protein